MPLRARSGSPSSVPSGPWAILPLAAAAAPAAAAAASSAGHARVHHRVGREGGVAGGNGGEVGDHTPRVFGAALGTLRDVVGGAHRAHEVEAPLAVGALVLVEGHLFPTSRSATLRRRHCTAPRALKNTGAARKLIPGPNGAVAQLGERRLCTAEVRGSNPLGSTSYPALQAKFPRQTKLSTSPR